MNIRTKKGFTLMEMLIVVAIIAILVAIAIPVFSAQLDNARKAVDDANKRSALSEAVTYAMTDDVKSTTKNKDGVTYSATDGWTVPFIYDKEAHTLKVGETSTGYNESEQGSNKAGEAKLQVTVDINFNPTGNWVAAK